MNSLEQQVAAHYGKSGLLESVLAGAVAAGADMNELKPVDLSPVDEFHTAGRAATMQVLQMLAPEGGMHVLDAGSGLGGTARVLASEFGCHVTGIDLTPEYIDVARALTERMKLSGKCDFRLGSVTAMPFADSTFDAAVSFHVAMNVPDRPTFYGEVARVVRPGARFALFDVMKGPRPGMAYPVPWAETEATSFLMTAAETESLLQAAGFRVEARRNLRDFAIRYFRDLFSRAADVPESPPLGLHLLTGDNAGEKFANYAKSLEAHQIEPIIVIARQG